MARTARPNAARRAAIMFALLRHYGGRCAMCDMAVIVDGPKSDPRTAEVGHAKPASDGGSSFPGNLFLTCHACNDATGTRDLSGEAERLNMPMTLAADPAEVAAWRASRRDSDETDARYVARRARGWHF